MEPDLHALATLLDNSQTIGTVNRRKIAFALDDLSVTKNIIDIVAIEVLLFETALNALVEGC